MNKFTKLLLTLILVPLAVMVPVFLAQTLSIDAHVTAQQSNLQQRIEQYKSKLQKQPSKSDLDKLKLRCTVAQERLKAIATKTGTIQEKRVGAYDSINKSLTDLTAVLKEKNVTTTTLEANTKELKTKTDAFKADMAAYKQAVEDASNVDCANDPLALKASLEEARNYHTKLMQEVADIRSYINNVVKITLKQVRDDLVTQQKTTNDASSDTSNQPSPDTATQSTGGNQNATQ